MGYYLNLSWPHGLWLGAMAYPRTEGIQRQFSTEEPDQATW
jgi:hypothetical protein